MTELSVGNVKVHMIRSLAIYGDVTGRVIVVETKN